MEELIKKTLISKEVFYKIATASALMQKAGIKLTKAKLFMDVGINSLQMLTEQKPVNFRDSLKNLIEQKALSNAIPTPKEVLPDISWAKHYPVIIEGFYEGN